MPKTDKLFKNGRSQAVHLPKEFRFDGTEVHIYRKGESIILKPIKKTSWPKGYWESWDVPQDLSSPRPLLSVPVDSLDLDK